MLSFYLDWLAFIFSCQPTRYTKIVRDRMIAVIIFAFFTVFFWMSFEQGATSLVLFARDYVDRTLVGNGQMIFNIVNNLLTIIPLAIITGSNFIGKRNLKKIPKSNYVLAICFIGIWLIVLWMLERVLCNGIRNYRIMV